MSKHTPGPWATDGVQSEALHDIILGYDITGAGSPILIASVYGDDEEPYRPGDVSNVEAEANARRIVACVNACEGIADPASLRFALEELVKLQSHYADLLNMFDGGQRHPFASAEEWLDRLEQIGKLPK